MINIQEIIINYKEQGYSGEDALIMAKADLSKKSVSLRASTRNAELRRVNEHVPKDKKYSVIYGAKKGVM